jgi:hypothetical protein
MISYDEAKRRENLHKHGIDLAELGSAFDFQMVTAEDARYAYGEQRLQSLAQWQGRVVVLIWTPRADRAHLISCRYADKHETRRYLAAL